MHKTQNGWTKEKMIQHVKENFRGKSVGLEFTEWGTRICLYRGPEGKKCAVGMFLPDELYNPEFENKNAYAVFKNEGIAKIMPLDVHGMVSLQETHDDSNEDDNNCLERILDFIETKVTN